MRNWRTSLCGLVAAAAGFVAAAPELFHRWTWAVPLAKFVLAGGLACTGLFAADSGNKGKP